MISQGDGEAGSADGRQPISFLVAAGWSIALFFSVYFLVGATEELRPGAMGDLVNYTACHLVAHLGLLFVMLRVHEAETPLRSALAVRGVPAAPLTWLMAAVVGAGVSPSISWLSDALEKKYPTDDEELAVIGRLMATPTLTARVVLVVSVVVAMPLVEELFFRGFVFGGLRRGRALTPALVATTAFYGLSQASPPAMAWTLTVGLVLTWLRAQTGSVVPAIIAHMAFVAVPTARLLVSNDPLADDVYPRVWMIGGAAAALAAAAVVWRACRGREEADA